MNNGTFYARIGEVKLNLYVKHLDNLTEVYFFCYTFWTQIGKILLNIHVTFVYLSVCLFIRLFLSLFGVSLCKSWEEFFVF